ncbi:MAG: phage holin family protein [Oligoflexales bacterium]
MAQHRDTSDDIQGTPGSSNFEARDLRGHAEAFFRDMRHLFSQESRLLRQELREKTELVKASGMTISAGFVVTMMALQALVATIVIALAYQMPWWGAALLTSIILGIIGLGLVALGRNKVRKETLKPTRSIETLNEIGDRIEEKIHEYKPSA